MSNRLWCGRGKWSTVLSLGLVLLFSSSSLVAESIYYEKEDNGALRLTNAPIGARYQPYDPNGSGNGKWRTPRGPYARQIGNVSERYGIDPNLVKAIISTESSFDPRAVSPKGARGLMQLMPATAARFGVKNIHDPLENIQGGVRYFRHLLDLFQGDLVLALAAYNAGEGAVQRRGRVPNYPETKSYIKKVLKRYQGDPRSAVRPAGSQRRKTRSTSSAADSRIYRAVSRDGVLVFSDVPLKSQARR